MKKFLGLFVLVLALMLTCNLGKNYDNNVMYAQSENNSYIIVVGNGTATATADTVSFGFGVRTFAESIADGYNKINDTFNCLSEKIKEIDENAQIYISHSSSHPLRGGYMGFECSAKIDVCLKQIDKLNDVINAASDCGISNYFGAHFGIENSDELYNDALLNAKENAKQKATSLYGDVELVEMRELRFCCHEENGQIKIDAVVATKYKTADSNTTQSEDSSLNDDTAELMA